jgi:hypothetical protein
VDPAGGGGWPQRPGPAGPRRAPAAPRPAATNATAPPSAIHRIASGRCSARRPALLRRASASRRGRPGRSAAHRPPLDCRPLPIHPRAVHAAAPAFCPDALAAAFRATAHPRRPAGSRAFSTHLASFCTALHLAASRHTTWRLATPRHAAWRLAIFGTAAGRHAAFRCAAWRLGVSCPTVGRLAVSQCAGPYSPVTRVSVVHPPAPGHQCSSRAAGRGFPSGTTNSRVARGRPPSQAH